MAGMSGPSWLADLFAAVVALVAIYSLGRLVALRVLSRRSHVDVDIAHVGMGVAMSGMLVASLNFAPSRLWEVVFGALALWFIWRCYKFVAAHGLRGLDDDHVHHLSHYVTHVVMALAMLYMYLAATTVSGTAASATMAISGASGNTADFVGLPLVFLVVLLASGIWELDGADRFGPSRSLGTQATLALVGARTSPTPAREDASVPVFAGEEGTEFTRGEVGRWLAPGLEAACHVAMCATMAYMLIVML